jgi:ATP-dependent exoDNAse (exonuclease V) alpha subunit
MLDVLLANSLVKAIPPGAHLLFVGDVDQLPSVGVGEALRDLLDSDVIPSVRLTHIFRQAQPSGVVTNAHRINAGQMPVMWRICAPRDRDNGQWAAQDQARAVSRVTPVIPRQRGARAERRRGHRSAR